MTVLQIISNITKMGSNVGLLFLLLICKIVIAIPISDSNSLVVSSTESVKADKVTNNAGQESLVNPEIYSMSIQTNISNRFATTLVTSKVRNLKSNAAETTFSVILPENAFISQFEMEIKGNVYKAYVKEKEEAKKIYEQAVAQGQSAGHVELSARDSKTFTVSVNVEPESKTIFRLIYEELLQRQIGHYELVVNIHPGQIVNDLNVQVFINETRPLTFLKTPSLRTGNEISKNEEKLNPSAEIKFVNGTSAVVRFSPDVNQQKEFAQLLGVTKESGLAGQFIVQYDVERDPQGGEVLVRDGYFVHFFSPSELKPLKKHVVFVLDHSGSMVGRKVEQLIEAMENILSQLTSDDLFNMVRFNNKALVWNNSQHFNFNNVNLESPDYGNLEPQLKALNLPQAVTGTQENIYNAKLAILNVQDMSLTNIIAGLEVGLFLSKRTQKQFPKQYQPMIIFLTDGIPNVDIYSGDEICNKVAALNSGEDRASIFSLSFGSGADKKFLRKLSSQNLGFSRHIFEASDSSLQLEDFYRRISSPLLSNVTFKYVDGVTDITKAYYPILFKGSELVVAGRAEGNSNVLSHVTAWSPTGVIQFRAVRTEPISPLERLWAYLTVQQILKEQETATNKTELTQKALNISLKYSFVTSVSSLVVVKPNNTDEVDSKNVDYSKLESSSSRGSSASSGGKFNYGISSTPRIDFTHIRGTTPSWEVRHPLPAWLENLKANNGNITTPQGTFQIGNRGDVVTKPSCPNTPQNTTGVCTIIMDCPDVFKTLTDINIYLKYFCPLNAFAGVCCPT